LEYRIHTTTKSVESAIAKFCKIDGLSVRRKTRTSERSGKTNWWFIVHGEESKLCDLENEWERISVQTSWEIRPCFMPAPDTGSNTIDVASLPSNTDQNAESQAVLKSDDTTTTESQVSAVGDSLLTNNTTDEVESTSTSENQTSSDAFLGSSIPNQPHKP
jgi:hypothetical protein